MYKIPPSVEMEKDFFKAEYDLSGMVISGAQLMLQKAIEMEVTKFLGRQYHLWLRRLYYLLALFFDSV